MYNVTPRNIVKTKEFYLLWSIFFCITCILNFINSYQKTYAQKFIQDDTFFANIAIVQNVINGSARLVWGGVYDKMGFQVFRSADHMIELPLKLDRVRLYYTKVTFYPDEKPSKADRQAGLVSYPFVTLLNPI